VDVIPEEIRLQAGVAAAALITERVGSHVWRVVLDDGRMVALKYATDDADPFGITRKLVAREAAVLTQLGGDYLVGCGDTSRGSWLAVKWLDGPTLWQRWRHALDGDHSDHVTALHATWASASTIARLHAGGWCHGDLQGVHILTPDDQAAQLIDFGVAQGSEPITLEVAYRGGFAHLNAPEVAAELLVTANTHSVPLTTAAEVYTFGAVVFTGWARQWPRDYGHADPADLRAPEIYTAIADPSTLRPAPGGWPRMAELITAMLDQHPDDRPMMAQIHDALAEQAGAC
jgi:serine/threonine protein kinase